MMLFVRGLLFGLLTGALSAAAGELANWAPGLIFAAIFLPLTIGWLRKSGAIAVSGAVWWFTFQGAGHAVQQPHDQLLFWARWGAQGAALLGLGLLLMGCFPGSRRYYALPLLALVGALTAQLFGTVTDHEVFYGFMAWQGGIAAVLTALIQAPSDRDL
jgi:hypothetical protein